VAPAREPRSVPSPDSVNIVSEKSRCNRHRRASHLSDAEGAPLVFPQKLQGTLGRVVVVLGDGFEHGLGQLHMAVFVLAVRVAARVRLAHLGGRPHHQRDVAWLTVQSSESTQ